MTRFWAVALALVRETVYVPGAVMHAVSEAFGTRAGVQRASSCQLPEVAEDHVTVQVWAAGARAVASARASADAKRISMGREGGLPLESGDGRRSAHAVRVFLREGPREPFAPG